MNDNSIIYPRMASVKRAAEQFGCSAFFVRKLCREGKIRYVQVSSRRWLVNLGSLAEFFEKGDIPAEEEPDTVAGIRRVAP